MTFLYLNYKLSVEYPNPNDVYTYITDNKTDVYLNEKNRGFLKEKNIWALRLGKDGSVTESFNKPREVKDKFNLTDVASFTRYYLADYPVFTYLVGDDLLVFAYPKNSLDKLPFNYYNYQNLIINLCLVVIFIILFLIFVYIFYRLDIRDILKNISPFQRAIDELFEDDYEKLDESGELRDLAFSINKANEKYNKLKKSQSKWIRGVSHDVRTPLAKISWELSKKNKNDLDTRNIQDQVLKISNILESLNLTMSLANIEKENFEAKSPLKVIRKVIVDKLNENPKREIIFENRLGDPDIKIKMDPTLFYRMVENIIKNSLAYTEGKIELIISNSDNKIIIRVLDQGCGVDEGLIKRINDEDLTNITRHGLGIFIAKQIAELHDGKFSIENKDQGLDVSFIFDLVN